MPCYLFWCQCQLHCLNCHIHVGIFRYLDDLFNHIYSADTNSRINKKIMSYYTGILVKTLFMSGFIIRYLWTQKNCTKYIKKL